MHPIDTPNRQSWNIQNKDPLTTKLTQALYNTIQLHPINNNRSPRKQILPFQDIKKNTISFGQFYELHTHSFAPTYILHPQRTKMRFTILLAALSASTLITALPTVNSTDPFAYDEELETGIEKRGTYGWLSNYAMTGNRPLPCPIP